MNNNSYDIEEWSALTGDADRRGAISERGCLSKEVILEQRTDWCEEMTYEDSEGGRVQAEGRAWAKTPRHLASWKTSVSKKCSAGEAQQAGAPW